MKFTARFLQKRAKVILKTEHIIPKDGRPALDVVFSFSRDDYFPRTGIIRAETSDETVGILQYCELDEDGEYSKPDSPPSTKWMVKMGDVYQQYRRLGIAKQMYHLLFELARKEGVTSVESDIFMTTRGRGIWRSLKRDDSTIAETWRRDPDAGEYEKMKRKMWKKPIGSVSKICSPNLKPTLEGHRQQLAALAQGVYDEWDASDEEFGDFEVGFGGICHLIAEAWAGFLSGEGFNTATWSHSDEVHVSLMVWEDPPDGEDMQGEIEVIDVDLNPHIYETGGGYNWKKIPNVTIDPDDISLYRQFTSPENLEALQEGC